MHNDYNDTFALAEKNLIFTQKIFNSCLSNVGDCDKEVRRLIIDLSLSKQKIKILLPDQNDLNEFIHALSPLYGEKCSYHWHERISFYLLSRFYALFGNKLLCCFSIEDRNFSGAVYRNSKGNFMTIRAKNLVAALRAIRIIRNLIRTTDMQTI